MMLLDRAPTCSVENVDFTMERNAQHMAYAAGNAGYTTTGSNFAGINKCKIDNSDHHLDRKLKAKEPKTSQRRARYTQ